MNRRGDPRGDPRGDRGDSDRREDNFDRDDFEFNDALRAGRQVQAQSMRRPEAIRPEAVDTGAQFWNDQRMAEKTTREKEAFLRDKGLSSAEIREVRARAEEEMLMRQPPPPSFDSTPTGVGRAMIQGQQVQYIPIPIPAPQGGGYAPPPPTMFSRFMGMVQTLALGAGMLVAGNYAYQQYTASQQNGGGNPMLTWGGQQHPQQQPLQQPPQHPHSQQQQQQQQRPRSHETHPTAPS